MLGGSIRLSASDAALVAMSAPPRASPPPKSRPRTRDPILGIVPEPEPLAVPAQMSSTEGVFRNGSREFAFPPRGTIASVGEQFERCHSRQAQRLEYQLWRQQQKRASAEDILRTVTIHGRSTPPWMAPPQMGTERFLMPVIR